MAKLKSAQHHWWPRCVSANWAAEDGKTGWLKPDGACLRIPADSLGVIRDGHHIKLGNRPGESTSWDCSFEDEFNAADNSFPSVISWLSGLNRDFMPDQPLRERFIPIPAADDDALRRLTECVVSLAVRSPMNREASVAAAEHLRGPLKNPERKALIGANMRHSQRVAADTIGANAKFAVLFSERREFVFGDGFFHNLTAVSNRPYGPKLVAPITPHVSVMITKPLSYMVEPRLATIVLSDGEVDTCNDAIQVYARHALYFRSHKPVIKDAFAVGEHRRYSHPDNPMDSLLRSIPGIPPRDRSLDVLLSRIR